MEESSFARRRYDIVLEAGTDRGEVGGLMGGGDNLSETHIEARRLALLHSGRSVHIVQRLTTYRVPAGPLHRVDYQR